MKVHSTRLVVIQLLLLLLPTIVSSLAAPSVSDKAPKKFFGGAGVGRLNLDSKAGKENAWLSHYDMVLCERIQGRPKTKSGLFVPEADLPKLHICKVLSVGPGREEENGFIAPMPSISVGDYIIAKNPWGIGPKDEETTDGKKLSYMRSQDIAAIIPGGLLPDDN